MTSGKGAGRFRTETLFVVREDYLWPLFIAERNCPTRPLAQQPVSHHTAQPGQHHVWQSRNSRITLCCRWLLSDKTLQRGHVHSAKGKLRHEQGAEPSSCTGLSAAPLPQPPSKLLPALWHLQQSFYLLK